MLGTKQKYYTTPHAHLCRWSPPRMRWGVRAQHNVEMLCIVLRSYTGDVFFDVRTHPDSETWV